jgi:hypothetical protein
MKSLRLKKNENEQRRARQGQRLKSREDFNKQCFSVNLLHYCGYCRLHAYIFGCAALLLARNIKLKGETNNS